MALKFGTSGVRGLVTEMTDLECYLYTKAYVEYLRGTGASAVCIAGDYRSSTPRIIKAVIHAVHESGLKADYIGYAPTPMLAYHSMKAGSGAVMVTGSHIPDDRNGIKFYMPAGEILKDDEQRISAIYADLKTSGRRDGFDSSGMLINPPDPGKINESARVEYVRRYTVFFPAGCLNGLKIVFYQHSTVGRTILPEILEQLGAEVCLTGWSDTFVPVDTEAVDNPEQLAAWVKEHNADALVSADGDCDRPLLVDESGKIVHGDILGILAATFLKADSISTPVSCNTALEQSGRFEKISRTKIGSPFVIAAMNEAVISGCSCVVGYEANGGFLTGTDIAVEGCSGRLTALPTRDAALPILSVLISACRSSKKLSELKSELPPRFTVSGIIREFPTETGKAIVSALSEKGIEYINSVFMETFGECVSLDLTDGCRMSFADGGILHFRPSGNAPEFRIYTEYADEAEAAEKNETGKKFVLNVLKPEFS